jgi:hypothetical protein
MAGRLISILPKSVYDFSGSTVGSIQKLVLAERVDISQYIDCVLAVRVHSLTQGGSNNLLLDVFGDGYTDDDPSLTFVATAAFFPSSFLNTAPGLVTYGGTARGHFARLILTAVHGTAGIFSITLSADLVLRSPDSQ